MVNEVVLNDDVKFGADNPFVLLAGPCVIESEDHVLRMAEELKKITTKLDIPYVFKSSYDKANRSSIESYRGPGLEKGLKILQRVKDEFNLPVLSDVHSVKEAKVAGEVLNVIQVPAFLSRQTDLVTAVGKTGRVVNVKKGQFLAPWDIEQVIEKIESTGNKKILLTERGASFGYNNLVVDMRSLPRMRETGYPVVFDATHSVQLPGGAGDSSTGEREYVPYLTRAAVGAGIDSLFMEVHDRPDTALCDGPNMVRLEDLEDLLKQAQEINNIVRRG
ncbi:3-deoxy-8-phosphooctulonate synthase [Halobacteroides halobius DSM 5150]|uniref:2-dehydro-3-deoxyphosphooctonate aldolase n=1 Tax=Halobacteroides halobius (strain ATCC 35273 / DSM 5150 / MD-1) TaxID=748449 RepID=L0KAI3_HALHC|nr:3-deoxy-8-phosphooctulonate synthase [Halobacteroides halobius]AGB42292.1 3-deoxy-8-phosphooctulonate synthase [Halobacteroides halobius DSM 5150]